MLCCYQTFNIGTRRLADPSPIVSSATSRKYAQFLYIVCLHRSRSVNYLRCCFDLLSLSAPARSTIFLSSLFSSSLFFTSLHINFKAFCLICLSRQLMLLLLFWSLNVHILEIAFIRSDYKSEIYVILGKNFLQTLARLFLFFSIPFQMKKLCHSNEQKCLRFGSMSTVCTSVHNSLCCCRLIWLPTTDDAGPCAINLLVSSNILDRNTFV